MKSPRYNVYRNFGFFTKQLLAENLELPAALRRAEDAVAEEKRDDDGLGQYVKFEEYPPKRYQTIIETMTAEAGWVTTIISVELIEEKAMPDNVEIQNTNGYCDTCGDMYTRGYESHHPRCKTTAGITFDSVVLTTPAKVFIVSEPVYNTAGDFSVSSKKVVFYDHVEATKAAALLQKGVNSSYYEYVVSEHPVWNTVDQWAAAEEQLKMEEQRQKLKGKLESLEKEASDVRQALERLG